MIIYHSLEIRYLHTYFLHVEYQAGGLNSGADILRVQHVLSAYLHYVYYRCHLFLCYRCIMCKHATAFQPEQFYVRTYQYGVR